jgi:hypothetical protein
MSLGSPQNLSRHSALKKILCLFRQSNLDEALIQPVTLSLYWLSYLGSITEFVSVSTKFRDILLYFMTQEPERMGHIFMTCVTTTSVSLRHHVRCMGSQQCSVCSRSNKSSFCSLPNPLYPGEAESGKEALRCGFAVLFILSKCSECHFRFIIGAPGHDPWLHKFILRIVWCLR